MPTFKQNPTKSVKSTKIAKKSENCRKLQNPNTRRKMRIFQMAISPISMRRKSQIWPTCRYIKSSVKKKLRRRRKFTPTKKRLVLATTSRRRRRRVVVVVVAPTRGENETRHGKTTTYLSFFRSSRFRNGRRFTRRECRQHHRSF